MRKLKQAVLNDETVLNLTKNILKRYEHNIEDGTLFLHDVKTRETWVGNASSNDLIRLIDGKRTVKEIYEALWPLFEDYEYATFKESFDSLIADLIDKKFLRVVKK